MPPSCRFQSPFLRPPRVQAHLYLSSEQAGMGFHRRGSTKLNHALAGPWQNQGSASSFSGNDHTPFLLSLPTGPCLCSQRDVHTPCTPSISPAHQRPVFFVLTGQQKSPPPAVAGSGVCPARRNLLSAVPPSLRTARSPRSTRRGGGARGSAPPPHRDFPRGERQSRQGRRGT